MPVVEGKRDASMRAWEFYVDGRWYATITDRVFAQMARLAGYVRVSPGDYNVTFEEISKEPFAEPDPELTALNAGASTYRDGEVER